jgi:hypothetical protein
LTPPRLAGDVLPAEVLADGNSYCRAFDGGLAALGAGRTVDHAARGQRRRQPHFEAHSDADHRDRRGTGRQILIDRDRHGGRPVFDIDPPRLKRSEGRGDPHGRAVIDGLVAVPFGSAKGHADDDDRSV